MPIENVGKEIEEEFLNQGEIAKAGLANDLSRHILEGGGFWYFGELLRHLGGPNNVYRSYYNEIDHLRTNGYYRKSFDMAIEAAEYARQQKDMLQFWGFIYEAGGIDYAVSRVLLYCQDGRSQKPVWYYVRSLSSCEYYWSLCKKRTNKGNEKEIWQPWQEWQRTLINMQS